MSQDHTAILSIIATCDDATKLRNWISNARRKGVAEVEEAAITRLITIGAADQHDGTLTPMELDFWKSIFALEFALSDERGKTIRLSRTRQKIDRVGVQKTLADLAMTTTPSDGFGLLAMRGMLHMSAEAVILRHQSDFTAEVIAAAQARLDGAKAQSSN